MSTESTARRYKKVSDVLLGVFFVSIALLVSQATVLGAVSSNTPHWLETLLAVTPFLAVVLTFFGFIATNALAWSKEMRERKQAELDLEKKQLEIEKLRKELYGAEGAGEQRAS